MNGDLARVYGILFRRHVNFLSLGGYYPSEIPSLDFREMWNGGLSEFFWNFP